MSTTERAFANLANIGPSAAEQARIDEINRTIARTMAEVVATRSYNPNQLTPNFTVTPSGAGKDHVPGTWDGPSAATPGWSEPQPLTTPRARATDEHVRRIADHFAPHAPASPLRKAEPEGVEVLKATMARAQAILDKLEGEPKK
jgi:hypothetical protein